MSSIIIQVRPSKKCNVIETKRCHYLFVIILFIYKNDDFIISVFIMMDLPSGPWIPCGPLVIWSKLGSYLPGAPTRPWSPGLPGLPGSPGSP